MTLPTTEQRARPSSPAEEPLGAGLRYDYADAVEVNLREGDNRTAERMVRTGLEQGPAVLGRVLLFVHRHVLRFRLGPVASPKHVVGWQIVMNEPDVLYLRAEGSLFEGVLVARRTDENVARLTTFVAYQRPLARIVWAIVGPVHRRVAPHLMERAALTRAE